MEIEDLKTKFYAMVAPSMPNEWDVEEALSSFAEGSGEYLEDIFSQIPAIWPVSHSLCFAYMAAAEKAMQSIAADELSLWVHTILDRYETGGLRAAQIYMDDVGFQFARQLRGQGGLRLTEVAARLQPYVNGLAGRELPLIPSDCASTDTECIYLPSELGILSSNEDNFLLYKLMVSFQWATIAIGSLAAPRSCMAPDDFTHPLEHVFKGLSEPQTGRAWYHFFETARALTFLTTELPGLMRQASPILVRLPQARPIQASEPPLRFVQRQLLVGFNAELKKCSAIERQAVACMQRCLLSDADAQTSLDAACSLMPLLVGMEAQTAVDPLVFQGILRLNEAWSVRIKRRQERELQFIKAMSAHILATRKKDSAKANEPLHPQPGQNTPQDIAVLIQQEQKQKPPAPASSTSLRVDNQEIPLTEELRELAAQIRDDLGALPDAYISSAAGLAGRGFDPHHQAEPEEDTGFVKPVVYDEWDFRRKGFRKNWCVLTEREMPQVQTGFLDQTLQQYKGQIRKLRHQFELMRTGERFIRRQREGNDIDVDALVESLSDIQAGRPPSDRLFIRLARDQRDIAVYFLVDMSNSTAGWVGKSIKESLILICEAMEVLNDRYGIYGFSGMRRLRCEVFPVKRLDERYSVSVRQRISAIGPREYTRMAPAIRHMTSLFTGVDAKIRLLIILSDGKPEDYDDYKGTYAIEDTRHALLEAKAKGIHPFCITIDRQAHEYMAHMYGEVNYIFIDEVRQLPARMPEIYRILTT